jgi:hypothetical protein
MSWGIEGKWTRPDCWETIMFGWHVIVEQQPQLNGMWQATIEPLVEPFKGSPTITAPQFFYGGDLGGQFEGTGWCFREILRQWSKVFAQWRNEPAFATNPLRQKIVERLRQYELRSALILLGINSLTNQWGRMLKQQRQSVPELQGDMAANVEPTILIWETVRDIGVRFRGPQNRLPQGERSINLGQLDLETRRWAEELMQYPFYPTVNLFSQAVIDWIETCDLKPFLKEGDDEVTEMWHCLRVFDIDQP